MPAFADSGHISDTAVRPLMTKCGHYAPLRAAIARMVNPPGLR